MKFQLISDGAIDIPPTKGWGALERVVWAYKIELEKLGHEVLITNTLNDYQVLKDYRYFNPDIIHNHLGKHWYPFSLMNAKRKIFTNHGSGFKYSLPFYEKISPFLKNSSAFVLTENEKIFFKNNGIESSIVPNGVNCSEICFEENAESDSSIYLAKILPIKRQAIFEKMGLDVLYVGDKGDPDFNYSSNKYIGQWNYDEVKNNLTKFSNLVLLSIDELQPLVCLEAMSAGLGLVISEPAAQSLDREKPWISVVPEDKMNDVNYLNFLISRNRKTSRSMRAEIRDYAQSFDWKNIIEKYITKIQND